MDEVAARKAACADRRNERKAPSRAELDADKPMPNDAMRGSERQPRRCVLFHGTQDRETGPPSATKVL